MSAAARIREQLQQSLATHQALLDRADLQANVADLAQHCVGALRQGAKIIFAGNGGSFADAQHLSAELTSRFLVTRAPLASLALGTNSSSLSAIGNDFGYEHVFARELAAVGRTGDVFVPITTSGNSANILAAIDVADRLGLRTVVLTGQSRGRIKPHVDCICVPSDVTARIQECHILIGHVVCGLIEAACFPGETSRS